MLLLEKLLDNTFSAGHKIEDVRVETHKFQFLYNDGEFYHFMNEADYTQIRLLEAALDNPDLMKEGEVVTIIINTEDNMPLSVDMPASVILEVTAYRTWSKRKYSNKCNKTCNC